MTDEPESAHSLFISPESKKLLMKTCFLLINAAIFLLNDAWNSNYWRFIELGEELCWTALWAAYWCFGFAIIKIVLEMSPILCKYAHFSKIYHFLTLAGLKFDLNKNDLSNFSKLCLGVSITFYRLSLRDVVPKLISETVTKPVHPPVLSWPGLLSVRGIKIKRICFAVSGQGYRKITSVCSKPSHACLWDSSIALPAFMWNYRHYRATNDAWYHLPKCI